MELFKTSWLKWEVCFKSPYSIYILQDDHNSCICSTLVCLYYAYNYIIYVYMQILMLTMVDIRNQFY